MKRLWIGMMGIVFVGMLRVSLPFGPIWSAVVIPTMMLGTVSHPLSWVGRLLSLPPVRWVGRISYSLYLWQGLFLIPAWERHRLPAIQIFPVGLLLTVAAAALSYYVVERPLIAVGRRLAAHAGGDAVLVTRLDVHPRVTVKTP